MLLQRLHPDIANRDCNHCREFVYIDDPSDKVRYGKLLRQPGGEPQRRPPGSNPPCMNERIGCVKGRWDEQRVLTEQNRDAWLFYRPLIAAGCIPDEPLAREVAAAIIEAETMVERAQNRKAITESMEALVMALASVRR